MLCAILSWSFIFFYIWHEALERDLIASAGLSFDAFHSYCSVSIDTPVNWKPYALYAVTLLAWTVVPLLKSFKIWNDKIAFHHEIDFIHFFLFKKTFQFSDDVLNVVSF